MARRQSGGKWFSTLTSGHPLLIPIVLVVWWLSHVTLFVIPWTTAYHAPLSFSISRGLLKFMSIELMMYLLNIFKLHPAVQRNPGEGLGMDTW